MKKLITVSAFLLVTLFATGIASAGVSFGVSFPPVAIGASVVAAPSPGYYRIRILIGATATDRDTIDITATALDTARILRPGLLCHRVWVPGYWQRVWTGYGWQRIWHRGYYR